jgi:nitrate/nitrite transport system ATP-binding protein
MRAAKPAGPASTVAVADDMAETTPSIFRSAPGEHCSQRAGLQPAQGVDLAFIELRGVSKSFDTPAGVRPVLRDVSLDIERGEFVSVVGAMGSGKSTLLSMLAGLTAPDAGTIAVAGEEHRGIRRDSAFVFQNYSLLPWLTALENVRLAVEAAFPDVTSDEQRTRAGATLERVGLGQALHRRPSQLSGGMRQRVALARALATRPRILFLDDPFGALDALTREALQQDLMQFGSDEDQLATDAGPVTTVMITNSVEEAILLSDRIIPIVAGPPATVGPAIAVELSRPRTPSQLAHDELATRTRAHVVGTLTASMRITRDRRERKRFPAADDRSVRCSDTV